MIEPWYMTEGLTVEQAFAADARAMFVVTLQRAGRIRGLVLRFSVTWYVGSAAVIGAAIVVLLGAL